MKKFILFLLISSFFTNQSFAASENSCAFSRQNNVTTIVGVKDGQKYSYKNHCYKETNTLLEYSCEGTGFKVTKTTCANGCDKTNRVCITSSATTVTNPDSQTQDLTIISQSGSTLFEYSTVAQRLGILNDYNILLNKILDLRQKQLGESERPFVSLSNEISNIQQRIQNIVSQKREILEFVEMLKREITLRNEQLDIISEVKRQNARQFRDIQSNADGISQALFRLHSLINEEVTRIPTDSRSSILDQQLKFLEENDKLLKEKLKLLQELTLIKM